MAVFLKANLS